MGHYQGKSVHIIGIPGEEGEEQTNPKSSSLKSITIRQSEFRKYRISEASRKKRLIIYKGILMKSSVDFSVDPFTLERSVYCSQSTQREYRQPRIPCSASHPSEMTDKDFTRQ